MAESSKHLIFDLGAESGRAVVAEVGSDRIDLQVVHRFPNMPVRLLGRMHWDAPRLYSELLQGIREALAHHGQEIVSAGADTWGVDFALLDKRHELLGLPYHYRDHRTDGVPEQVFEVVPKEEVYNSTGIQFMQLNTLFQLASIRQQNPGLLDSAAHLLFIPDLLHFWLTGEMATEVSIASTSQFYNPATKGWAFDLLKKLDLPSGILNTPVPTGQQLGPLHSSVLREVGKTEMCIIAPACHDTGSAVAGAPGEGDSGWAYISCGTWSLVGVERPTPVISERTLEYNLTNEVGHGHSIRLLRNVMGLWLLQQCRSAWEREGRRYSYNDLAAMSAETTGLGALVEPDDSRFLNPENMPAAIRDSCQSTGQEPPRNDASMVRCILDSLALKYRWVIERLEEVTGQRIHTLHLIGGGSQNAALCQATADATGRRTLAGPVEATAAGNAIIQAMSCGSLGGLEEGRALIRRSFPPTEYVPRQTDAWQRAYERFVQLDVA